MLEIPAIKNGEVGRVSTATFIRPADVHLPGYEIVASPCIYSGQKVSATISTDQSNSEVMGVTLFFDYLRSK